MIYNATNQELVRTNTLTKGAIVMIDATPFRQYYATKYGKVMGQKKGKSVPKADQVNAASALAQPLIFAFSFF